VEGEVAACRRERLVSFGMSTLRVHFTKSNGRGVSYHRYPNAHKIVVSSQGVLSVADRTGSAIAVYAAENWTDAYFEDQIGDRPDLGDTE